MIPRIINFVYEMPHKLPNDFKLGNITKTSKLDDGRTCYSTISSRNKILVITTNNYAEEDIKFI